MRISEAANGVGEEMADLGLAMQRAEDKTETMRARASRRRGARGGRRVRRHHARSVPARTTSTASSHELTRGAQVDDELAKMKAELGSGRRRRAGARAGRGGEPRDRPHRRGEGQFQLPDEDAERLNELDNRAVAAVEQGDEDRLPRAVEPDARARARATATPLDGDELVESDVIMPPRDIAFDEAKGEFTGDGLIPD